MPYKNAADRRAQKKRWAASHRAHELKRWARYRHQQIHEIRDSANEKNFRFRMWEMARVNGNIWELMMHNGTALEMANPCFVFELNGQRHRDTLHDPLPEW